MQSISRPLILKQALLAIVLAVALSCVSSAIKFSSALEKTRQMAEVEHSQFLSLVEIPAERAAFFEDRVFAGYITASLLEKPLIYRAELVTKDGDILADADRFDNRNRFYALVAELLFPNVGHYTLALSFEPHDVFVGRLSIWIDQEVLAENFLTNRVWDLAIDLLKDIVLASLILSIFFVFVIRPLNRLTQALHKHKDDLSQPLPALDDGFFANNELGALSDAFSQIWSTLEKALKELERSEAYSSAVIMQAGDAIFISNIDGQINKCNNEAARMLDVDKRELNHANLKELHDNDSWDRFYHILIQQPLDVPVTVETEYQHASGRVIPVEIRLIKYVLQEEAEVLLLVRDISKRKQAEYEINQLAYFDSLTHLPNRHLIMETLRKALASCKKNKTKGALFLLDLDRFKNVNDSLGHDIGDQLLKVVSKRLDVLALGSITAGRLGGDEFVFILPHLSDKDEDVATQADFFAKQVVSVCSEAQQVGPHLLHVSVSIGVTFFDGEESNVSILLKQADTALYSAKDAGRNTYRCYKQEMQAVIDQRLQLEKSLHRAVRNKEFELYFQPQNTFNGALIGAEVLVRWQDGDNGFVSPHLFIPVAEEIGLINEIGEWVMESALSQLAQWLQSELWKKEWTLSVNVSPIQFQHPEFVSKVELLLKKYKVPAELIDLELTENMLLDDLEDSRTKMNHFRSLGMKLSIDDFGTGYSSLQYLKNLPISRLKIDQSFVRDILTDVDDEAIVRAVIALAEALGIEAIAEGVETQDLLNRLKEIGCMHYQGYLFGRPINAELFIEQHLRQALPQTN